MGTVSLGKIAFSWRGPYAESVSYARQDVVGHQGDSWVCLVDGTLGILPGSDAAVWQLFAQGSLNVAGTAGDLIYFDGQQLAALGGCRVCHTATGGAINAGGRALETPFGTIYATNITPDVETGIGN